MDRNCFAFIFAALFHVFLHMVNKYEFEEVNEMPTEKPRYTIIVEEELLKQIDDFRFNNRYPSRSAATLELIRLGIKQLKKEQKTTMK